MNATIYTDASHCEKNGISACGFCVLVGGKLIKHQVLVLEGIAHIAAAEIYAITTAMQWAYLLPGIKSAYVNTDCAMATSTKRTHGWLKDFRETIELFKESGIGITINWVRAHQNNHYNNLVDRHCNKALKIYVARKGRT